jgi:hypothetical protein
MTKSKTKIEQYKNHAIHNESVCNYLELKPEYSDWIITSAFYTSLKLVSYQIFPFEVDSIGGKKTTISSIDDYFSYKQNNEPKRKLSRHHLLVELLSEKSKVLVDDYEWLLSISMKSRYDDHTQPREYAVKARSLMIKIKKKVLG